jgi:hypothetical protein
VRRLEERAGLRQVITAGFAFIVLGWLARASGALGPTVLAQLTPILQFGLGWLGFVVGYRFEVRRLDEAPQGTALAVALATALPTAAIAASSAVVIGFLADLSFLQTLRAAVVLGLAGAVTSSRIGAALDPRAATKDVGLRLAQIDDVAPVVGLLFVSAFFRPEQAHLTWALTGTAWLFILLGMGLCVGLLGYAALSLRASSAEFLAVTLGVVAFGAGMAGYLHLSPLVVTFLAGALVTNLPFPHRDRLSVVLSTLERPILFLFLGLAGALWDPTNYRGWLLVPVFLATRLFGRWLAALALRSSGVPLLSRERERHFVLAPLGVFAIAVVLSFEALYHGTVAGWLVTAVIGGAVSSEILVHYFDQWRPRAAASPMGER